MQLSQRPIQDRFKTPNAKKAAPQSRAAEPCL